MLLNRGGDRQATAAICRVTIFWTRDDDRTKAYAARQTAEDKTRREIVRFIVTVVWPLLLFCLTV